MSILVFFGLAGVITGAIETVQEEIRYAKQKRAYKMRRLRAHNRWIH